MPHSQLAMDPSRPPSTPRRYRQRPRLNPAPACTRAHAHVSDEGTLEYSITSNKRERGTAFNAQETCAQTLSAAQAQTLIRAKDKEGSAFTRHKTPMYKMPIMHHSPCCHLLHSCYRGLHSYYRFSLSTLYCMLHSYCTQYHSALYPTLHSIPYAC